MRDVVGTERVFNPNGTEEVWGRSDAGQCARILPWTGAEQR